MRRERRSKTYMRRRPRGLGDRRTAVPGEKKWTEYHRGRRVAVEAAPRMRIHAERRRRAVKRTFAALLTLLLVIAAAGTAWAVWFIGDVQREMRKSPEHEKTLKALTPQEKAEPFTVLLLGDDRRKGETKARTDTIIVARIDPREKQVRMVSIPRDTKAQLPGYHTDKINAAGYYGGPSLTVDTVEEFLGVPINHYMMVDFKGFREVVDAMGGIWIDVDVEIDDWKAASHSKSHYAQHIEPGYQLLTGDYALTYVRSREFPDADFTRMKHQQTFFKALAKQSLKLGNAFKLPGMVKVMAQHTQTDMSATEILRLVQAMRGIGEENVQTATITGQWVSPYVIPDEAVKERLADALRTGADIETSAAVTPAEAVEPSSVTVTVRNGAGIAGCAADAASRLEEKGYRVGQVGNANQFVYDKTLVIFKDQESKARSVAAALGVSKVVESRGMYAFSTDVLVVVGKDWQVGVSGVSNTGSRGAARAEQ